MNLNAISLPLVGKAKKVTPSPTLLVKASENNLHTFSIPYLPVSSLSSSPNRPITPKPNQAKPSQVEASSPSFQNSKLFKYNCMENGSIPLVCIGAGSISKPFHIWDPLKSVGWGGVENSKGSTDRPFSYVKCRHDSEYHDTTYKQCCNHKDTEER